MTEGTYHPICSDHDFFLEVFDEDKGHISHLPHLIMPTGAAVFKYVMDVLGLPGGIWTEEPRFDESGDLPDTKLSLTDTFRLWGLEANQEQLFRNGGIAPLGHMGLVFNLATTDETLQGLVDCVTDNPQPHLDDRWDYVIENIDDFRWAYITIAYEDPLAALIVRPGGHEWIDALKNVLDRNSIPHTRVITQDGRETWILNDALRELCRLDYEAAKASDWKPAEIKPPPPLSSEEEALKEKLEPIADAVYWSEDSWVLVVVNNDSLEQCCQLTGSGEKEVVITAYLDVTDEGLKLLPAMERLVSFATGRPVTTAGLSELVRHPNLRILKLVEIQLNPDELSRMQHFAVFPSLEELEIDGVELSDKDIDNIKKIESLKTLVIDGEYVKGSEPIWDE